MVWILFCMTHLIRGSSQWYTDSTHKIWILIQGLFLYNLHNHNMCEFYLDVQGLRRTLIIISTVLSFLQLCTSMDFTYTSTHR